MKRASAKKVLTRNNQAKLSRESRKIERKLRDPDFLDRALKFLINEINSHHGGKVSLVLARRRSKFFTQLAKKLGSKTRFRILRTDFHIGENELVLHAQRIAFGKACLDEVRAQINRRRCSPLKHQIVPIVISLVASRTALEFEGVPVVSLNNGCPCCQTKP